MKAAMAYFKILSQHFLGEGGQKTIEKLRTASEPRIKHGIPDCTAGVLTT
jgi:hypothetical protein